MVLNVRKYFMTNTVLGVLVFKPYHIVLKSGKEKQKSKLIASVAK